MTFLPSLERRRAAISRSRPAAGETPSRCATSSAESECHSREAMSSISLLFLARFCADLASVCVSVTFSLEVHLEG